MKHAFIALSALTLVGCSLAYQPEKIDVPEKQMHRQDDNAQQSDPAALHTGSIVSTDNAVASTENAVVSSGDEMRLLESGVTEIGNHEAAHTLVLYTEPHCGYCREFIRDHLERLKEDFISSGTLRVLISLFPLEKYEHSSTAAAGLICAGEQGASAQMLNTLFTEDTNTTEDLTLRMEDWSKNTEQFSTCLTNTGTTLLLQKQKGIADSLGVTLVPTLILDGDMKVGLPHYADLRGWIEVAIEK